MNEISPNPGGTAPHVLFVCTGNAGRSQIAQVLFEAEAQGQFKVSSAGVRPWKHLHPKAVELLSRTGYSTEGLYPKSVLEFEELNPDLVVTIGEIAKDELPVKLKKAPLYYHIDIPDPADFPEMEIESAFESAMNNISDSIQRLRTALQKFANRDLTT